MDSVLNFWCYRVHSVLPLPSSNDALADGAGLLSLGVYMHQPDHDCLITDIASGEYTVELLSLTSIVL